VQKTVLVTGAAGFIGSHTVEALLRRGDRVIGLDDFCDYYPPARKRQNLREVRSRAHANAALLTFVEGDVRDGALLDRLFAEHPFDAVVHLAAMGGVRASLARPELYLDVNLVGTLRLLERARAHALGHFVFASTSSVYGATDKVPFVETDSCDRPLAPYPASKRAAELLGHAYHHAHGLPFTALRFFTVYGPRGRPDMMPYKILSHLFLGEEVPLYDAGRMVRDWTYVGDIVSGIVAAIDHPHGYAIINLGRGQPVAVSDFIAEVERQTNKTARFRKEAPPATDMRFTHADLTRATTLLRYAPSVSIAEGVHRFCEWFREAVLNEG
jgi:UDP-glucuronate 4-epimerase